MVKLSDKAVSRLRALGFALAVAVGALLLAVTLARIFFEHGISVATGIQLALVIVVLYQAVALPIRHRRWLRDLERLKTDIEAGNAKGEEILAQMELTAPDRAELEAWRHVGELRGIRLHVEAIREPKLH